METKADLRTRGGRVQHVRLALATRYGNVSLEKFGALVAAEQQALTGEAVKPYVSSTVMRWEAGADLFLGPALAIASLGAVSVEWIALGDAKRTRKAPTPEQESRTKVAKGVVSQRPEQRQRKKN